MDGMYDEQGRYIERSSLGEAVEALTLPPGVHVLSEESRLILEKAALRGSKLAARHIKRGS